MNNVIRQNLKSCSSILLLLGTVVLLSACGSGSSGGDGGGGGGSDIDTPIVVTPIDPSPTGNFEIRSTDPGLVLVEGDQNGLSIPLSLERKEGHDRPVQLTIEGLTAEDDAFVTSSFTPLTLTPSDDESEAILTLSIGDLPLEPQQREFLITASDGVDQDVMPISVTVQPTPAPDVYLLVGQSNMVGFSGEGTREAFVGGLDEPNVRIKQLNASKNNEFDTFLSAEDYTSPTVNTSEPSIVTALDPLHIPLDENNENGKEEAFIGPGLSFAKQALVNTSADIILVPAAWSGSSFCANDNGPPGNWMADPSDNPNLGNTWLVDRAVTRANLALSTTNGVLRGILWHQGESDANDRCAPEYEENLKNLVDALRTRVQPVGSDELLRSSSTIPFILGTMSRGADEREDLSEYLEPKQMIDDVHRNFPNVVEGVAISINDDLIPANGYPCGNSSCIHFGAAALREMGQRYYEGLLRAVAQ